jgi:response regulator RpfG family c-di-GMP phosphodiesterase
MDVQLPKISGIEATRALRAEPSTAHTPIIAITSFALSGDEQRAKEAGASAYLAKPCETVQSVCPPRHDSKARPRVRGPRRSDRYHRPVSEFVAQFIG